MLSHAVIMVEPRIPRCPWAADDPQMIEYHDAEWGVPVHERRRLFEMLTLEGAQAGLSWSTILRKRNGYRAAFSGFNPARVARFGAREVRRLMSDERIVRNRLKIESTVTNARALLRLEQEVGPFDRFVWGFVGGRPMRRRPRTPREVPATSVESDALSKALRGLGFRFVGSTICYAFMQACGLVDDHVATCFRAARRARSAGAGAAGV